MMENDVSSLLIIENRLDVNREKAGMSKWNRFLIRWGTRREIKDKN